MLEVLCKPTLTLFVKKPFLFWREKNFPVLYLIWHCHNQLYFATINPYFTRQVHTCFNWFPKLDEERNQIKVSLNHTTYIRLGMAAYVRNTVFQYAAFR